MQARRVTLPLALAASLAVAAPAAAAPAPVAHTAGGDVGPPVYPGLVNSRLVRTQKALDRAVDYADDGQTDKAVSALYAARLQVKLAWRAGRYAVEHAPPPAPPGDGLLQRLRARARRARAHRISRVRVLVRASAVADPYTTAGGVLDMQHVVAQTAIGMIDTAHGKLRDSLSRTIFTALDQRDAAVTYIHSIDVPPPPGDGLLARASGAPVGGSWATVMPPVADEVDDEINQIEGALALSSTLGVGIKRTLQDAEFQAVKTQRTINQYWPPVLGDD
jgi:hypothetical protein